MLLKSALLFSLLLESVMTLTRFLSAIKSLTALSMAKHVWAIGKLKSLIYCTEGIPDRLASC